MRIKHKVVARFHDGSLVKGFTHDFSPYNDVFHITRPRDENEAQEISMSQLKAVFFVKSFQGDQEYKGKDFTKEKLSHIPGLKLKVTFADGETIYGTTTGYSPQRKGFFLMPANKASNNERLFVIREATSKVETWV